MKKNFKRYYFCLPAVAFILLVVQPVRSIANVKMPAIFSDGLVLQQQARVSIWGWAAPREAIAIRDTWSDKTESVIADESGNWKTTLQTPKAGGPYAITIKANNTIELKDVLIGEVWVCSGQSNMVFSLKSDAEGKSEISKADNPSIRYFSVERQYGPEPFADAPGSSWKKSTPQTAPSFSAVAYYFARKIQQQLKVPVGIVYAAWGGTPAEAWTPAYVMQRDTVLSAYFDRWKTILRNVSDDSTAYLSAVEKWKKDSSGKKPTEPQTYYYFKRPWREPAVLFNGMINPVIPYGVKGILWYQGESNVFYPDEYFQLFGSMIRSWRTKWNGGDDLPFYFVQISAFGYNDMDAAAQLREAQFRVMKELPNTGMAVSVDLGNMKDIHYTHKRKVGERLALIALARDYGYSKTNYKGPDCSKAIAKDDKVILEFGSSVLNKKGEELKGFELGYRLPGSDSLVFLPAQAKIEANRVVVWNENVRQPIEVRYAWLLPGGANLFDTSDLPAYPFRKRVETK